MLIFDIFILNYKFYLSYFLYTSNVVWLDKLKKLYIFYVIV